MTGPSGAESTAAWAARLTRELLSPGTDPLRRRHARRGLEAALRLRLPAPLRSRLPGEQAGASSRYDAGFPPSWRDQLIEDAAARAVVVCTSEGTDADVLAGLADLEGSWDLVLLEGEEPAAAPRGPWRNVVRLTLPPGLDPGWALVALAGAGLLDACEVVLHVGSRAGAELAQPEVSRRVQSAFAEDLRSGLVAKRVATRVPDRPRLRRVRALVGRLELSEPQETWQVPVTPDFWVRGFLLQGLRALDLPLAELTGRGDPDDLLWLLGALAAESGCRVEPVGDVPPASQRDRAPGAVRARVVPFYLPQFHPTPENDRWWGRGFTEWTNVSAAKPVYTRHHQPKLPQELGFYDLRLDETREAQARLAREHGIGGFLYYHYWFSGRRILERPLDAFLASDLDFPFALMWANENWTRTWDGGESSVLLSQDYGDGAAAGFIDDVLPYLRDRRYLRVGGRALLSVYRAGRIPDLREVVTTWRRRAAEEGIELYVAAVDVPEAFGGLEGGPSAHGIDAVLGFPPHQHHREWASTRGRRVDPRFEGHLWSYAALVREDEARLTAGLPPDRYPTVMAGFDNTARRQWTGTVFLGANPYTFRRWLARAVEAVADRPDDQRIVFVNAWNEWAEGAVLEPSDRFGRSYLQAVRDVVGAESAAAGG